VVTVGVAVTDDPVVADNPLPGDHVYVVAPDPTSAADPAGQIATSAPALTAGVAFTETNLVAVPLQPLVVPVTVYVVVAVGVAVTLAPVVAVSPVDGDHV
jgi:hypothetical protein